MIPEQPKFDYRSMPHLHRLGQWTTSGNYKMLTQSLFVEKCPDGLEEYTLWTLKEDAVYSKKHGKWFPSAWLVFINADDEYDAAMKIVGNLKQWELLKSLKWFDNYYQNWYEEWRILTLNTMRNNLMDTALNGSAGAVTAARTIIQLLDQKNPTGRPKKVKEPDKSEGEEEDMERILRLVK